MSNNTGKKYGGRESGTPNKLTSEARQVLKQAIQKEMSLIENHFNLLEPKDRLEILVKLLPFILPKANNNLLEGKSENIVITLDLKQ
jgi:hypothetical protein